MSLLIKPDRFSKPVRSHTQIDRLADELYGLTEEEIKIVEEAT